MTLEQLKQEREWLQHRLYDLQKSSGLESLKEALEVKQHLEKLNTKISATNNYTSSQKK